jgi:hypothetical protein
MKNGRRGLRYIDGLVGFAFAMLGICLLGREMGMRID